MVIKQLVAALIVTMLAFAIAANGVAATRAVEDKYLRYNNMKQFQMLPKEIPILPSGPSSGSSIPRPYPPTQFQMLPKQIPIPPKQILIPPPGPSSGSSIPPPYLPTQFQMLPKKIQIPPLGPSNGSSIPRPPPPTQFQNAA